jgi:hypothetical protein
MHYEEEKTVRLKTWKKTPQLDGDRGDLPAPRR